LNQFAPRLSFFFAAFTDLFEEVAKFRAARRLWARLMKEQFQANDAACRLRFHTQTGGSTLTAQQPENNVVRVAIQALASVAGASSGRDRAQRVRGPTGDRIGGEPGGRRERVRGRAGRSVGARAGVFGAGAGAAQTSRGAARDAGGGTRAADLGGAAGGGARS